MVDYKEKDITKTKGTQLKSLISARVRRHPSVEIIKRGKKIILRTWHIRFDVSEFEGEEE